MKNKIGWCNLTWNPVWGCRNNCEYCYARGIANLRAEKMAFWEMKYKYRNNIKNYYMGDNIDEHFELKNRLQDFKPTFLERQFNKKFPKKPQRIFVGSMSEIYYWDEEWIERVIEKVKQYPQHTFQFLTKYPQAYADWVWPKNCWLGVTIVEGIDSIEWMKFKMSHPDNIKFICLEPLIRPAVAGEKSEADLKGIDWVIIGAETGNRKGKVIPKLEWIDDIIYYCRKNDIPIYLKDSLKLICPSLWKVIPIMKNQPSFLDYRPIKEFPKEVGL